MSPRTPRRSYSKSPVKTKRRDYDHCSSSDSSCSNSRRPPSPPGLQNKRSRSHCYSRGKSSSRSMSPHHRHRRRSPRSVSRSPPSQRHHSSREKPEASECIGVFGLNVNTTQQKVRDIFVKFGPIKRIQMVIDAQTKRSRGFCFIYYEKLSDAKAAKDACSGMEVDERRIRVDYSITKRPHTPTPGVYMGRPTKHHYSRERERERERERDPYEREHQPSSSSYYRSRRRSPSPSYKRDNYYISEKERRRSRYDHSRSRSRSAHRSRY